ncbi:Uncharacterised protein [Mycobacterium tuberculosis]|nr:Uncharacterised protein [Mycobacterium tuberculosis]
MGSGSNDRAQRGLAGRSRQRRGGAVDGIGPGVPSGHIAGELATRCVVGVQVNGQVEATAQGADQPLSGRRAQQSSHILDRQHMGAGVHDLLSQFQVVVQRVQLFTRIGKVARVAHRDFCYRRTCFAYCVDRRTHRLDVVERVEDTKDVDTGGCCFLHKRRRHDFRVRRVAHGIAAPQ